MGARSPARALGTSGRGEPQRECAQSGEPGSRAPGSVEALLRETSVLFGAGIAVVVLKEPLRAARIAAALLIVAGLVLIRLQ